MENLEINQNEPDQEINEALLDFKKEESDLLKDITSNKSDLQKQIKEKENWNTEDFYYEWNTYKITLTLEKKGNNVFVKLKSMPTYMGKTMDNEFKEEERKKYLTWENIDASSSSNFLTNLWWVLDIIVGTKWRGSAAEKAQKTYDNLLLHDKK